MKKEIFVEKLLQAIQRGLNYAFSGNKIYFSFLRTALSAAQNAGNIFCFHQRKNSSPRLIATSELIATVNIQKRIQGQCCSVNFELYPHTGILVTQMLVNKIPFNCIYRQLGSKSPLCGLSSKLSEQQGRYIRLYILLSHRCDCIKFI